jgi:acetylornithine deacetylase/succinyl-diaminopimelate desuccinylase-like protein
MRLAGMRVWQDAIGNVHGEMRGGSAVAGALLLGSHYDTVKDAGAYDGPLGIVAAIAAVKVLVASHGSCEPKAGVQMPPHSAATLHRHSPAAEQHAG